MDFAPRPVSLDHREKRTKVLVRSTGSFSMIDDIIAPTPRKISNISCSGSPSVGRREKRKGFEEMLFGEAGFEIQNILLQPREVNLSLSMDSVSDVISEPLPITQVLNEEGGVHPKMVTSLRSSNPITLNSPFHFEDKSSSKLGFDNLRQVHQPARLYQPTGRSRNHHVGNSSASRKESNHRVERSASWPTLPNSPLTKKAEKSS